MRSILMKIFISVTIMFFFTTIKLKINIKFNNIYISKNFCFKNVFYIYFNLKKKDYYKVIIRIIIRLL